VPSTTPDRNRRLAGRGQGQAAQVRLGLHGQDLGDGHRVVGEIQAVAGADLKHPTVQAGQQPPSVVADLGVHEVTDPRIDAGEDGMADRSLLSKRAHRHPSEPAGDGN
jgi:hypothetical protein